MGPNFKALAVAAVASLSMCAPACCAAAPVETILYSFTGMQDGGGPAAGLTKGGDLFYGTTYSGGAHGFGTVFSIDENGAFTLLYSFKGYPDAFDVSQPLLYADGALYGVSRQGGKGAGDRKECKGRDDTQGCGTVFKITPDGQESILYAFSPTDQKDGWWPSGPLVKLKDKFYGETYYGGNSDNGTIFVVDESGREKVLYGFSDEFNSYPASGLAVMDGILYGTAPGYYCDPGYGIAFSITPAGVFKSLHNFAQSGDGNCPQGPMLPINGTLYGSTEYGGAYGEGTLYTLAADGTEEVITSLDRFANGPIGNLVPKGGHLYSLAGGHRDGGSLFRAAVAGGKFADIWRFGHVKGGGTYEVAGLVSSGGSFYGSTSYGGTSNHGLVYKITP